MIYNYSYTLHNQGLGMSDWIDRCRPNHENKLLQYLAIWPIFGYDAPFFFPPKKAPACFCFRNKRQQRSSVYFGYTFAPDDCTPLQFPDYRLFGWVVLICYDSGLIYRQLSWLHLAYEENEEVMSSMLVSLYCYYIISPNLGSHPVIV